MHAIVARLGAATKKYFDLLNQDLSLQGHFRAIRDAQGTPEAEGGDGNA
jgi:hypothetical protein